MTGPRVTAARYTRDEETCAPDGTQVSRRSEEVDAEHVRNYLAARSFFEAGGWVEEQRKRPGGIISVKTTEPDGTTHLRLFTPIRETARSPFPDAPVNPHTNAPWEAP
jgi:hypothetical protein